jgi:hypothetical protein
MKTDFLNTVINASNGCGCPVASNCGACPMVGNACPLTSEISSTAWYIVVGATILFAGLTCYKFFFKR